MVIKLIYVPSLKAINVATECENGQHDKCPGYSIEEFRDECKSYSDRVRCQCRHHGERDRFANVPKE